MTVIKGGKVALPDVDEFVEVDLRIENEKIAEIGKDLPVGNDEVLDAKGLLVLPGGIDPHVHFNTPGYTDREDFYHGSAFAAQGGITTVIDMPCTSIPPVTDIDSFNRKLEVVSQQSVIDFGFYGGVSAQSFQSGFPKNMESLADHVLGYKTYFISGMETFGRVNHFQFERILQVAKSLGRPVLLHAEDYDFVVHATETAKLLDESPVNYYLSRPELAEILAVASALLIAESVGAPLHIVHIGTARAAELLRQFDATGETCPHYLQFDVFDLKRVGSPLKTTPPVKLPHNKFGLWHLLAEGVIDFVASDHAPAPKEQKFTGSIWTDYAGIPGTGTLLPYMFSQGLMMARLSLRRFLEVTAESAAKRYGIFDRKGSIEVGKDADLVLIDPNATWKVRGDNFLSKGHITPFEGMELRGKIVKTIVRGRVVFDSEKGILVKPGYGKLLRPSN